MLYRSAARLFRRFTGDSRQSSCRTISLFAALRNSKTPPKWTAEEDHKSRCAPCGREIAKPSTERDRADPERQCYQSSRPGLCRDILRATTQRSLEYVSTSSSAYSREQHSLSCSPRRVESDRPLFRRCWLRDSRSSHMPRPG